jgi:hypothetical protein
VRHKPEGLQEGDDRLGAGVQRLPRVRHH